MVRFFYWGSSLRYSVDHQVPLSFWLTLCYGTGSPAGRSSSFGYSTAQNFTYSSLFRSWKEETHLQNSLTYHDRYRPSPFIIKLWPSLKFKSNLWSICSLAGRKSQRTLLFQWACQTQQLITSSKKHLFSAKKNNIGPFTSFKDSIPTLRIYQFSWETKPRKRINIAKKN